MTIIQQSKKTTESAFWGMQTSFKPIGDFSVTLSSTTAREQIYVPRPLVYKGKILLSYKKLDDTDATTTSKVSATLTSTQRAAIADTVVATDFIMPDDFTGAINYTVFLVHKGDSTTGFYRDGAAPFFYANFTNGVYTGYTLGGSGTIKLAADATDTTLSNYQFAFVPTAINTIPVD